MRTVGRPYIAKELRKSKVHLVRVPVKFDKEVRRFIRIHKYRSRSEFYYSIAREKLEQSQ